MPRKRANGEGSIRKRENGTWEARIQLGNDPVTGKPIRKSVYAKTQKEARSKLQELIEKKKSQNYNQVEDDKLTLDTWLDMWLNNYLVDIKPNTILQYESVVRLHIKPALGSIPLKKLRTPVIQAFYNDLQKKELSSKFIKNIHGVLHRALDMAVRIEYLQKNPSTYTVRPRVIEKPVSSIDTPEQKRLIAVLNMRPIGTILLIALYTGMRIGEILGLTWDCIDFENGNIRIAKQLNQARKKGQKPEFGTPKNGKTRIISPASQVMKLLKEQREYQNEQKEIAGEIWNEGHLMNLVFTRPDGSPYSDAIVWKEFQRILADAGIEHHRVHDLRHTFAVNSIRAGDDIKTLQENMGHYSAAFTLDRYGHVTETMRRESAHRMEHFLDSL